MGSGKSRCRVKQLQEAEDDTRGLWEQGEEILISREFALLGLAEWTQHLKKGTMHFSNILAKTKKCTQAFFKAVSISKSHMGCSPSPGVAAGSKGRAPGVPLGCLYGNVEDRM